MKSNYLKMLILGLVFVTFSCSKDKEAEVVKPVVQITKATLVLKKTTGEVVSGITVYAYEQSKWQVTGDNPTFASGQASSDASGNAIFSNLEYTNTFTDLNNNQNNIRFSAYYTLNGVNKKKVTAITFNKGDQKTQNIILD